MVIKKVLGNRVLVSPEKQKEKMQSGVIIPVTVNVEMEQGLVLGVGDQVINVMEEDRILYPAGAGIPVDVGGATFKFIEGPTKDSPGHIIAII